MRPKKISGLEQVLYGDLGTAKSYGHPAPSAVTMLVSLFLILITFFVVLNNNAKPDAAKRKVAFESMQKKFGKQDEELKAFGGVVKPKVQEFTIKLEQILGEEAAVEATLDGEQTSVIFPKDYFFYRDEIEMRSDRISTAQKLGAALREQNSKSTLRISIIGGMQEYNIDKKKIAALGKTIGIEGIETGLSNKDGNQIKLVISNE